LSGCIVRSAGEKFPQKLTAEPNEAWLTWHVGCDDIRPG
jgi:hypothetical protein